MNFTFLEQYSTHVAPHLPQLKLLVEEKLRNIIDDAGMTLHSLNGRVKTISSLEKKLARPDRSYQCLSEVTDLLAFRMVTYSEDLIYEVARIVEKTFEVDFKNSVNKLHQEDSQKFGYRSLHYICALPKELSSSGINLKFEIQIRTILQHAWAEIEHDIGYKVKEQLPREYRRRFSQISSLLEVADREFASIREDLGKYANKLKCTDFGDFKDENLELDSLSLMTILERSEVGKLDHVLSVYIKKSISSAPFYPDYILRVLHAAGFKYVGDIFKSATLWSGSLDTFLPVYFDFAKRNWGLEKDSIPHVQRGYGLLFLAHLHILNAEVLLINKVNRLTHFYHEIDYPRDLNKAKDIAQSLVEILRVNKLILE